LRKKISNRSLSEKGKTLRPEVYLDGIGIFILFMRLDRRSEYIW
jgi:hypothetical protein